MNVPIYRNILTIYRNILTMLSLMALMMTESGADQAGTPQNPGHLMMALVDMKCLFSDSPDAQANRRNIEANVERHLYFIDKLAPRGVEFIAFPEVSINGYHFSKDMTFLRLNGPEVSALQHKAKEKRIYISAGIAEEDTQGRRWNTQFVIGPDGTIIGTHHKIYLTKEKEFVEVGTDHNVFTVKGARIGISTCADGTDFKNLKALVDNGAQIIYGPHANTTGGTTAGWYEFRSKWGGAYAPATESAQSVAPASGTPAPANEPPAPAGGWIDHLNVYAALHNHAALFNPDFDPPAGGDTNSRWASGAWFIGPDGQTLAQMPASTSKGDSKEFVLIYNVPITPR